MIIKFCLFFGDNNRYLFFSGKNLVTFTYAVNIQFFFLRTFAFMLQSKKKIQGTKIVTKNYYYVVLMNDFSFFQEEKKGGNNKNRAIFIIMAVLVSVTKSAFFKSWMFAGSSQGRQVACQLLTKATIGIRHRPYTTPPGCTPLGR